MNWNGLQLTSMDAEQLFFRYACYRANEGDL